MYFPRNNAQGSVSQAYTPNSGSLVLVDGSSFAGTFPIRISTFRGRTPLSILSCSGLSGNVLTITGALEGTADVPLVPGDLVFANLTAGTISDLQTAIAAVPTGPQGNPGSTGNAGSQGNQGNRGLTGNQGQQGVSGTNGLQGVVGAQGHVGNQGVQGLTGFGNQGSQGNPGSTGSSGASGAQGVQGSRGNQGTVGNQGQQGSVGQTGSVGQQGSTGASGAQGNQGSRGNQGTTGTGSQGAPGVQGSTGTSGSQGNQGTTGSGSQGATGNAGSQGNQGNQGVPGSGSQGALGHQGNQGTVGNQGATGSGSQGAQGNQGAVGSTGSQGNQGARGNQGLTGSSGASGATGAQGSTGSTGASGSQGAVGAQGVRGYQGVSGNQGNQGLTGVTGSQGNTGSTGASGAQGAIGAQGLTGSGSQGQPGNQGSKGDAGLTGPTGSQGNQGVAGNQGVPGQQGFLGNQGLLGNQGYQGFVGNTGSTGATGSQGNQGNQGLTGSGNQGATGSQGNQGTTGGPQGTQGSTGASGAQGNQGNQGQTGSGSQGVQGSGGAQGNQGNQGQTGSGSQGSQGNAGSAGPQGSTGATGTTGGTGPQGNQGYQGQTGTGSQGSQGNTGSTGPQGLVSTSSANTWSANQSIGTGSDIEIYNTVDQTTNYERFRAYWNSNIATIAAEFGGTGTPRNLVMSASNTGGSTTAITLSRSAAPFANINASTTSLTGSLYTYTTGSLTPSSGVVNVVAVAPTIATSSTGGYTCLLVNPTDTSTGTGLKNLADFQVGGTSKARVDSTGQVVSSSAVSVYNTTDQVTNYERLRTFFSSNVATISTEVGGTGTGRNLTLTAVNSSGGSTSLTLSRSSNPYFSVSPGSGGATGVLSQFTTSTQNQTSGVVSILAVNPQFSQTSTAGYTCLLVNPTETSTGSGAKLLADFQVGSTSKAKIDNAGQVTAAGFASTVASKTSAYTVTTSDSVVLCDATSSAFTVTLLSASTVSTGRRFTIKKVDSSGNAITIATTSSQTIDGASTKSLSSQWSALTVVSDGSNWQVENLGTAGSQGAQGSAGPQGFQGASGTGSQGPQGIGVNHPFTTDTDGSTVTFDMSTSTVHSVTLGGNRTLAVSNVTSGQTFLVILKQDGTGSRTVTWFSGITWANGTAPTLTTTANKQDVFSFLQIGTNTYLGFVVGQNF